MTVELISVGTELLLGNIINTNAAYLSEKCAALGLSCYYQNVVGDNETRLGEILKQSLLRTDIIILSGGLGPTQDDLTKEVVAKILGRACKLHQPSKESIITFFAKRKREITDNNWKQAMIPEGSIVVENPNGTAPGIIIEDNNKIIILMPGPPNELIPMFEEHIQPYLQKKHPNVLLSKIVKICGIGESKVETMILDLINNQTNPTIATYAKTGEVHLRITAQSNNKKQAEELISPIIIELTKRFGNAIYSVEEKTSLEKSIVDLLIQKKLTVATAESCTGGLLAARFINVSGVSEVFQSGHITYSNESKSKVLGIDKNMIQQYGAVSSQVAKEMAIKLAEISGADVTIGITGIAGPEGGSEEKPVGLVYIGCNICGNIFVKQFHFSGSRSKIRENAVSSSLHLVRDGILEL